MLGLAYGERGAMRLSGEGAVVVCSGSAGVMAAKGCDAPAKVWLTADGGRRWKDKGKRAN